MSGAITALRKAARARLAGDAALTALTGGVKVYDEAPAAATAPYIAFGEASARDWSGVSARGVEQVLTIEVWSEQPGAREALDIADRVLTLLDDAALSLEGHALVNLRFVSRDLARAAEGRFFRAGLRLRATTETL